MCCIIAYKYQSQERVIIQVYIATACYIICFIEYIELSNTLNLLKHIVPNVLQERVVL